MPPEELAHEALTRLAGAAPEQACRELGLEPDCGGVRETLQHLAEAVGSTPHADQALGMLRARVHRMEASDPARRGALMTLMMAQGEARRHVPLPFDRATLALFE